MTKKVERPLLPQQAREIVEAMLAFSGWRILIPSTDSLKEAMRLVETHKVPFWDANLAAVALKNKVRVIITENTKDFQILGIRAKNPFV